VYILLPPSNDNYGSRDQYYPLTALVNMLFFLQLAWIARMLYQQVPNALFHAAHPLT
jgi:hypothetical protein